MEQDADIVYHCLRFEDDLGKSDEIGGVSLLEIAMFPTKGICKMERGLLVDMDYSPERAPYKDKTVLEHTYFVHGCYVKTRINLAQGKITTRLIYMPENAPEHLTDCFKEVYRSEGEFSEYHGDCGESKLPPMPKE